MAKASQVTEGASMRAPSDNFPSSQPVLMRFLVRSWEYRRPRLWVGVRVACGVFNVVLGVLLLASVHWLGALTWLAALPLAGAALIFWTVYRLQQDSVRRVRELEESRANLVEDSAARLHRGPNWRSGRCPLRRYRPRRLNLDCPAADHIRPRRSHRQGHQGQTCPDCPAGRRGCGYRCQVAAARCRRAEAIYAVWA